MVWYSHLFQNFPQFIVVHNKGPQVKGFCIVNKAEIDVFPELSGFFYFCFIDYTKAFDCVDHRKLWKILKEIRIPDHLTCLLRNLYAVQEAMVRTGHGTVDWFQIRRGVEG